MPKIKNWERLQSKENRRNEFVWENSVTDNLVQVADRKAIDPGDVERRNLKRYRVFLLKPAGKRDRTLGKFGTKEQARKRAVKYMRNHPRG